MSASGLPYHLRPRKFVDRELFSEFVAQFVAVNDPNEYIYISMGGMHLTDHKAIYKKTSINCLLSFDGDDEVVQYQNYFKPFHNIHCENWMSHELPGRIDGIMQEHKKSRKVIWLDYTASITGRQLDEVSAVVGKMGPLDIIRVTVNLQTLTRDVMEKSLPLEQRTMAKLQADYLRSMVGSYLPAGTKEVSPGAIEVGLSECVESAFAKGLDGTGYVAKPVLLTQYSDTTNMFVATAVISDANSEVVPSGWKMSPADWHDITPINLPDFTVSERYRFDRVMHMSEAEISAEVGYSLMNDAQLKSYRALHRFYPTFDSVGG
ncbi:O-methyltransferase [Falsirhodobacter xinxiangensis]|uniref:O-methyltransferase n=1 Tax=Falsirhodobacter xinxiangensis TaxID=2530049 RepID=UPI0010AA70A5|nr:O-methyltransferase [Rhodobacter xinxiangensis]